MPVDRVTSGLSGAAERFIAVDPAIALGPPLMTKETSAMRIPTQRPAGRDQSESVAVSARDRHRRRSRGLASILLSVFVASSLLLSSAAPVSADEYRERTSGHPLRIIAYVLHPVGVMVEYLLLRPAHWVVSREPMQTLFGHED